MLLLQKNNSSTDILLYCIQTCMPEVLLPEVPRSVLQHLKEAIWMEKVSSTLEVGRGNQVQHSFFLTQQTGITTPIPNALQRDCVRSWTDYFTASQITFTSPGSYFSSHSRFFIASLFQITFRLPPLISPWQTLTSLYLLNCQTNLFMLPINSHNCPNSSNAGMQNVLRDHCYHVG